MTLCYKRKRAILEPTISETGCRLLAVNLSKGVASDPSIADCFFAVAPFLFVQFDWPPILDQSGNVFLIPHHHAVLQSFHFEQ